ncbi:MAG: hypothetical protein GY821_11900 [Gammaproteobacteria bacterium]|nr:hypothetical protein [Gammaproteobacteria bacterium]
MNFSGKRQVVLRKSNTVGAEGNGVDNDEEDLIGAPLRRLAEQLGESVVDAPMTSGSQNGW